MHILPHPSTGVQAIVHALAQTATLGSNGHNERTPRHIRGRRGTRYPRPDSRQHAGEDSPHACGFVTGRGLPCGDRRHGASHGLVDNRTKPLACPPPQPRRRLGNDRDRDDCRSTHPPARPEQRPHTRFRRDLLREGRMVPAHARLRGHVAQQLRRLLRRGQRIRALRRGRLPRPPAHRQVDHCDRHEDIRTNRPRGMAHHDRNLRHHHRVPPLPDRTEPVPLPRPHPPRRAFPGDRRHRHRHEPHLYPRRFPRNVRACRLLLLRQGPADVPTDAGTQAHRMGRHRRSARRMARPE